MYVRKYVTGTGLYEGYHTFTWGGGFDFMVGVRWSMYDVWYMIHSRTMCACSCNWMYFVLSMSPLVKGCQVLDTWERENPESWSLSRDSQPPDLSIFHRQPSKPSNLEPQSDPVVEA